MHGCKNGALFALVFLVLSSSNSAAQVATLQGATLLADMSAGPQARNGMAGLPVRVGEKLFFVAHARGAGTELHVSDANLEQIRLVTDLYPGLGGSSISGLQALGDGVVFVADDSRGRALWTSDGTAAGTYRIVPTPGLLEFDPIYPNPLTVVDDCVWFGADDGVIGAEPWRYCAHDRQLTLIGDLEPGAASSSPGPFYAVGERVLFETTSGIFVSDARSLEPRRFVVPEAPDLVILHQQTIEFRSRLYFAGTTAEHGREMWVTDGTESGTALLADLVPGPTSSRPTGKIVFNDTFYFAAEMPGVGHALLRFDGDTVEPAADLHSGAGMLYYLQSDGQRLVISAQGDDGELELWQSDGTQEGSKQLRFPDGTDFSLAYGLTRINDRSVIIAETWQQGIELWTLGEGDDASLSQVMDIQPGPRWGVRSTLLEFDDTLVFLGSSPETGVELWQTSGTPESTRLRLNLGQDDNADSDYFVGSNDGNDTVLFGPGVGRNDRAVWLTDATPAGTRRVRNFPALIDYNGETYPPTLLGAAPTDMGTTFAFSNPLQQQSSQWIVREGRVSRIGQFGIANPKAFGDGVIGVGVNGGVLRTTGEKGSVEKVFDPSVAVAGRIYPRMEIEDDLAWFFADTPDNRVALWRTDGTRGGAARVPDVALSYSPFWYRFVGALEQGVYFIAPNGGAWLWRADRTGAKPVKRVSVSWGSPGSYVSAWASLDDRLIFTIDSFGPHRFWVSNGTEAGTLPLFSEPYSERRVVGGRLVRFGAHLYFAARDSEHGVALWRTDGTPEGTELFHDVTPGFDELPLGDIVVHNDALYFVATSRASGAEIWQTDGLNVEQVTELMPGTLSADPQKLQSVQGKLVFAADDGVHGVEPWVLNAK